MEELILTSFSKEDLKELVKACIREVLIEREPSELRNDPEKLMTIKEAGEFLKLSVPTLYGHASKNIIPYNKKGKRIYFYKSELISWIKEGRRKTIVEIEREAHKYLSKRGKWNNTKLV